MSVSELLRNLANKLESKQNPLWSRDAEKQRCYLERQKEPRDDIERSYAQYKCQMWLKGRPLSFLINLASFPLMLGFLLRVDNSSCENDRATGHGARAVFAGSEIFMDRVPDELRNEYGSIVADNNQGFSLTKEDRAHLLKVWRRFPFAWHFMLKNILKVRQYRALIQTWSPTAIVTCSEYSFTSSFLTDYLNGKGIEHINVMHGSKVYYIRDSFFRFDRCYVWDESFAQLFIDLRASPDQFKVAIPEALAFRMLPQAKPVTDVAYYLGGEAPEQIERLSRVLAEMVRTGRRVKVRPHPRYTDPRWLQELPESVYVENPRDVSLEESVLSSKSAASLASTVLIQASLNGVPIVIDDVTDREKFEVLKKLRFLPFSQKHMLLSEVLSSDDGIDVLWRLKDEENCCS